MVYIPLNKKNTLINFTYKGGTDSILYEYAWSPLANFLLPYFPIWIAPNAITMISFLIILISHIIFMLPDSEDQVVADWKLVMMALAIIVYQHLDNIDGKQARRTGSSSPLGMLFDHGADAVNSFLISQQMLKILQIPYQLRILAIYGFIMSTYFCAMWSQYSIGHFKLGRINPIDEGLPVYALFSLIATQFDIKIFGQYHVYGTYGEQVVEFLLLLLIPQILYMIKDVYPQHIKPLSQILFIPILYFITGIVLIGLYYTVKIDEWIFHSIFYILTAMWSRNMILIQLQHITQQKFKVFNQGTNCFLFFTLIYIFFHKYLPCSPINYFLFVCLLQNIVFLQFVVQVLNQGANILGIRVFSLQKIQKAK